MPLHTSNQPSSRPSNSRVQEVISYRQARLQRSLARLRTHPAVNPTGSHGPHGFPPTSPSIASTSETHPRSSSSTPPTLPPPTHNSSTPAADEPSRLIPALFNDLVRRQLGVDPAVQPRQAAAQLKSYLAASRAVAPAPSLSDPIFVRRLSTGHDPAQLSDKKLLSKIVTAPIDAPVHMPKARDIHLAIQNAKAGRNKQRAGTKPNTSPAPADHTLRRSTRKRQRPQPYSTPAEADADHSRGASTRSDKANAGTSELASFRPSPESVRRTRSAAARARRSSVNKTPSECCFCPDPASFDGNEIQSELIGPFVDRRGNAKLFVHFDCACWAPQVYTDPANGQLRRVYDEYCRGRQLKCSDCGEKGATIGCYIQKCKRVFHYRCLIRARAYCVERFFAAFCEHHAHLGKKPSYKILMEAATIADVSAAQRREDTTYGLDAPHSRYTLLRRRETEVMFSRKWRISSHTGVFDSAEVVFSHRRRVVLGKHDKLAIGDGVRVLRTSAIDIASGRLAYMALADKSEPGEDMTAVEARAAIASRENTGLLLLRNLRGAPKWAKSDIEIVKSIPLDMSKLSAEPSKQSEGKNTVMAGSNGTKYHEDTLDTSQDGKAGTKRLSVSDSTAAESVKASRKAKRPRVNTHESANETKNPSPSEGGGVAALPSVGLPSFEKRNRSRGDLRPCEADIGFSGIPDVEVKCGGPQVKPSATSVLAVEDHVNGRLRGDSGSLNSTGESGAYAAKEEEKGGNVHLQQSQANRLPPTASSKAKDVENVTGNSDEQEDSEAAGKVRSAWNAFLDDQLPKERLLRPDDSMSDSMRNMARLWSLMTVAERDEYEAMARAGHGTTKNSGAPLWDTPDRQKATFAANQQNNIGLFMAGNRTKHGVKTGLKLKMKIQKPASKRTSSILLPKRGGKGEEHCYFENDNAPNWDELFPTKLDTDVAADATTFEQHDGRLTPRVRKPPNGKSGLK